MSLVDTSPSLIWQIQQQFRAILVLDNIIGSCERCIIKQILATRGICDTTSRIAKGILSIQPSAVDACITLTHAYSRLAKRCQPNQDMNGLYAYELQLDRTFSSGKSCITDTSHQTFKEVSNC